MWYFAWILGVLLACSFGIINALWLEQTDSLDTDNNGSSDNNEQ
ncbi:cytochrome bd-I oxidase subunit CydX [Vibrio sp. SS-MA-C1-2]|nr:cytochrome bd-I oxidase subunit CydX [Vibrio sp. SS-MA-C1-2]UJF18626.1 cytochrome bd-I oxidase subunit CydX [Vibrio sp. SS-MA-C1-2]